MPVWLAFIACVAALAAAASAIPAERRRVLPCAVALSLGWLAFQWAFAFYSPSHLIWMVTGAKVDPIWLWSASDAAIGFYIFSLAHDRGWGFAMFMAYVVQELLHAVYEAGGYSYPSYSVALDVTFCLQIACLIVGGWSGIAAWIGWAHAHSRVVFGRVRRTPALRQEAEIE